MSELGYLLRDLDRIQNSIYDILRRYSNDWTINTILKQLVESKGKEVKTYIPDNEVYEVKKKLEGLGFKLRVQSVHDYFDGSETYFYVHT